MFKKEMRLAVVIYGGASLALYMHGVSKELLKLVRASKILHEVGAERAATMPYRESPDQRGADTEAVYFELLKRINKHCHFRVVIDVIAGASAGAINGVMLGKAIVDDGELDAQTSMWLSDADVDYLSREKSSAWSKWYLYPFLRTLSFWLPEEIGALPETREKLARLVRSSWFEPPFSGVRLCEHFLDALQKIILSRRDASSLLPPGQRLDMYASITDLRGYPGTIRLNEELVAREWEHAAYCHLTHVAGAAESDPGGFSDANLPALVWAARASSSFAGAFPPFHHAELRQILQARGLAWPGEAAFLAQNVFVRSGAPASQLFDPADRYFVDGGIVNNKPFGAAMQALNQRSADRHVDRYIVYIEPDPRVEQSDDADAELGYLSTIRAALSTIPRNQPILDELNEIVAQDKRVQVNRRIVEGNREQIQQIVDRLEGVQAGQPLSCDLIAYLRVGVAEAAVDDMGLAFRAYVQRRVWRLTEALVDEWMLLSADPNRRETREAMRGSIELWWNAGEDWTRDHLQDGFLDRFDVTFRIRRLQFVIRRLNQHADIVDLDEESRDALDEFKHVAYGFLEQLYEMRRARLLMDDSLLGQLAAAAKLLPLNRDQSRELLRALSAALGLGAFDRDVDQAFFEFSTHLSDEDVRRVFLSDYVGFPLYDVLLFTPGTSDIGPDPLTPIRVERISPEDADSLASAFAGLRCRDLMGFIGFFNRGYREHDYLWGRLNGADRIVDLLQSAFPDGIEDAEALRHELFEVIVTSEKRRLYRCDEELAKLDELLSSNSAHSVDG